MVQEIMKYFGLLQRITLIGAVITILYIESWYIGLEVSEHCLGFVLGLGSIDAMLMTIKQLIIMK